MAREARTNDRGLQRYEPLKPTEAAREAALVNQIREAIALNSLELLYQPVVAVAGSDDSQYQVLLRLRGADGKLLPAGRSDPAGRARRLHPATSTAGCCRPRWS